MNIKYFLLFLLLNISFSDSLSKKTDIFNFSDEKSSHVIKRDIDLYTYNILFGSCVPIGTNVSNNYNAGSSLSLIIHTPYQTPNIINRFKFNVSAETIYSEARSYTTFGSSDSAEVAKKKAPNFTSLSSLFKKCGPAVDVNSSFLADPAWW